jgi:putative ABC transport system ATP-binding protein
MSGADPATDQSFLLQARDLYRFYWAGDEETLALRGVSVAVAAGEVVAVVGPSGSGKSTLLACLAGLDEPSGGTVWVGGERMSHRPEKARARLRASTIGIVLQSESLFDHLTVAGNVGLSQSLDPSTARQSVDEVLDSLGILDRSRAYPWELSGGEAARAGLAVALANDPPVILADEPTGELDGDTERRLLGLLTGRARQGRAVLVASHSPAVRRAADRVITLNDGRVSDETH